MLSSISYTGLVQVQFKHDHRDGRYKLLDINPRVWGTHALCQDAGVDLPYLLWRLLHGEQMEEVRARPGVHWVRMSTDLLSVAHQMRAGTLSLPSYVRSLRGPLGFAIFSADDPMPALLDIPLMAYARLKSLYSAKRGF
ncbi:MAG: ATP-grasp domain-containing protein [Chloroflexota bacterium]|nr:ATP-grasp domain-containing protein [Chloroflexota bacterium]